MFSELYRILNILGIIILILFSIFLLYQLIKKTMGGSWENQDILIVPVILIIGFLFNMAVKLTKPETNFLNSKDSFCKLAKDFKLHTLGKSIRTEN